MSTPRFVVVGPPNKGKSSIVATLARDDSVSISRTPGTTAVYHEYPMTVNGEIQYVLFDTPGFQRARPVLTWLKASNANPSERPNVIRRFVEEHEAEGKYLDECELLSPMLEPCAILYVVDGSVPYGPEYEAEMEILKWTGRPRMALINPIGPSNHIQEWKTALGQFFNLTRVFDALSADFQRQTELLAGLGELDQDWKPKLQSAIGHLTIERNSRLDRASRMIADMLTEMLTYQIKKDFDTDPIPKSSVEKEHKAFEKHLHGLEKRCRLRIEELYDHHRLQRVEDQLPALQESSLLSEESWRVFGLSRKALASLGATSGALVGGALDMAVGGSAFLFGTLIGASAGAISTLLGSRKLVKVKILNFPFGKKKFLLGPIQKKSQFPYVVFNRARVHHHLVANRAHALRGDLDLTLIKKDHCPELPGKQLRALDALFKKHHKEASPELRNDLGTLIREILQE